MEISLVGTNYWRGNQTSETEKKTATPERTTANQQVLWPWTRERFLPTRPSQGNKSRPQPLLTRDPREPSEVWSLQLAPKLSHIFNHSLATSTVFSFADDSTVAFISRKSPHFRVITRFLLYLMWPSWSRQTENPGWEIPEKVERTLVDFSPFFQTLSGVLLLPAAEHELLVGFVTLGAIVVSSRLQHCRWNFDLDQRRNKKCKTKWKWLIIKYTQKVKDIKKKKKTHINQNNLVFFQCLLKKQQLIIVKFS